MIKIALLFPGQGSQYNMMGKALYESSAEAREIFSRTNDILGYDLLAVINEGNLDQLTRTEFAQPAIFAYSYAIFQSIWKGKKFFPSFMAGHSLGEITALTCAGVFKYEDALRLVMERASLMQQATTEGQGGWLPLTVCIRCWWRRSVQGFRMTRIKSWWLTTIPRIKW
ncbi:ACP S-malonyltransferase [Paenibacillus sonchi]|uniref:[acyl-carrier-protein] S-malonyltransferase n=1 Tax=Paenibacillus sonchi TaxID=373687 RepID=A0A974P846_9BACL|nr:ACP S-malonyltransferase [Paenibacillus sonchi]QQZ58507.1 ACP S-malonyltransferase [Paenibacillus sonchi]